MSSLSSFSPVFIRIPPINTYRLLTPKQKAPPLISDDTKIGSWSDVKIDLKHHMNQHKIIIKK